MGADSDGPGTWQRVSRYAWEGPGDCMVSAWGGEGGFRYLAWGPTEDPGAVYWDWAARRLTRATYPVGEEIPQRTPLLGAFGSAEEARQACEAFGRGETVARPARALAVPVPAIGAPGRPEAAKGLPEARREDERAAVRAQQVKQLGLKL